MYDTPVFLSNQCHYIVSMVFRTYIRVRTCFEYLLAEISDIHITIHIISTYKSYQYKYKYIYITI